ncbi:MAG: NAD+ synthase [Stygiobacter sp. RIFOXYC12_FULL_38_8]|nr:MAG: NAD+ synthase [Stygiobacter sp. GWC2_38_9]OGV08801.1 MAG: NAD+ synthase [Stygiobacter sp. RIFOXYB2_FULL_37_11]OGV15467.1 MAG: NAD+ synthase [Stygiobacter sp. RIFOXYC2_FULL_38_25]OGV25325.1 MAG: NAD+ synthase [Stygiobacter sp. RIFOXYC12_FULL_38_8]OGV80581.1 MAG: NAD+ synthase [Stygiobacter sp. GWF2_38_21]RJQ61195.1 MAG: NAD+ synthase [Stygiobacter sp.]
MKIAVCQSNPIIGDLKGNKGKILAGYKLAEKDKADLIVFPELFLCGYPPLDLVEKKEFRDAVRKAAEEIAAVTGEVGLIFGSITETFEDNIGTNVYNSAILCFDGKIQFVQHKTLIPNYDVFDEVRYFESAKEISVFEFKGEKLGISICEDIWNDVDYWKHLRYSVDPIKKLFDGGATVLINISASPYAYGKRLERLAMLSKLTSDDKLPLVYACCVGAQTELIFDGASMCFDKTGKLCLIGKKFDEDYFVFDTDKEYEPVKEIEGSLAEEVTEALVLGLKDYARKTGFKKALIGLSGGIDSAIVAYLAVKAFGSENVHVVMMPSQYSSDGSISDSEKLIANLGISSDTISIQEVVDKTLELLKDAFHGKGEDVTEENLQSRVRGLYLMAMSNKHGYLLCTTGNKSEIATGYATLYGDMCGALAVIGDVYKTQIYQLANHINKNKEIIPHEIIKKAPSAELRPNQTDQDSLPPYDLLDTILKMYLEEQKEFDEISKKIGNESIVKKVLRLVDLNEFKRKQTAPVLRVSTKAFGYGRRFPIVQGWRK